MLLDIHLFYIIVFFVGYYDPKLVCKEAIFVYYTLLNSMNLTIFICIFPLYLAIGFNVETVDYRSTSLTIWVINANRIQIFIIERCSNPKLECFF